MLVHYLHLAAQETTEVYLGFMLMRNRYHYVAPFHKQVHRTLRRPFGLIEEFKSALSDLNYNCPANDPTRIVDKYLDPWWLDPAWDTDVQVYEGIALFFDQVCI